MIRHFLRANNGITLLEMALFASMASLVIVGAATFTQKVNRVSSPEIMEAHSFSSIKENDAPGAPSAKPNDITSAQTTFSSGTGGEIVLSTNCDIFGQNCKSGS